MKNYLLKFIFILTIISFLNGCLNQTDSVFIKYSSSDLKEETINLNPKLIKVKFNNVSTKNFLISESESGVKKFVSSIFNKNSENNITINVSFVFNRFIYKMDNFSTFIPYVISGLAAFFAAVSPAIAVENIESEPGKPDTQEINETTMLRLILIFGSISIASLIAGYLSSDLVFDISGIVTIDICDYKSEKIIYSYNKTLLIKKDDIVNTESDNEDFNKLLKPFFKNLKDDLLNDKDKIKAKYDDFIKGVQNELIGKEKKENIPIMLKIVSTDFKLQNNQNTIFRSGVEDALTENKYSLISEEVQEETLKEQAKQRKKECYDDSCLVETGKMLAARGLFVVEIVKSKESYLFKIKYINLETAEIVKTKSLVYSKDIDNVQNLLDFAKELTNEVLK